MIKKIVSNPQIFSFLAIAIAITSLTFSILKTPNNSIKYVDNTVLFNEFKMSKELVKIGENIFNAQKKKLDSLYLKLDLAKDEKVKLLILKKIEKQKQDIIEFNNNYNNNNTAKIWIRINQYLKEYAQKYNCDLILGTKTDGAFAANPKLEITNQVIDFINNKYEGNN